MIPKIIHFCWFGGKPIPKEYKRYIASWRKFCPDYKIVCWSEKNYPIESKNDFVKNAYKSSKWSFVSDYARLDVVYRYGGLYFDTDVEVLKNPDDLLNQKMYVGLEKGKLAVATGLGFGAEKHHPFVKQLRDRYDELTISIDRNEDLNITAPIIQTPMFKRKYNIGVFQDKTYSFSDCIIYPTSYFCPEDYKYGTVRIDPVTYTWHHYSGSWLSFGHKLNFYIRKKTYKWFGAEFSDFLYQKLEGIIK